MNRIGLIFLMLPLLSAAEVVVPIDSVENNVNIRMSPDSGSEIVGRLNQGDSMTLVESTPGWHEVQITGGATGFISADWSKVLDEPPEQEGDVADESAPIEVVAEVPQAEEVIEAAVDAEIQSGEVAAIVEDAVVDVPSVDVIEPALAEADEAGLVPADAPAPIVSETASAEEVVAVKAVVEPVGDVSADEIIAVEKTGPEGPVDEAEVAEESATAGAGPPGPQGPPGPPGKATVEGSPDFLMKFTAPTIGGNSQVYDDGNNIGIGTTEPKQRLEVNGNIQIHEQNSSVAGLMITQSGGETGYIMHNRASTLTIGAGSIDRITINRDGNVGFGVTRPTNPIELASGAHVTAGGVWTNSSSRARKENIVDLSASDALDTLSALEPVQFNYKNDQTESYVGFIAEDVPDLVATRDRDGLSAMDIVAVLTKVVQQQQKKIEELEARLDQR